MTANGLLGRFAVRPHMSYPVGSARLTLIGVVGCLVILAAFLAIRAGDPGDGTQTVIDPGRPVGDGLIVRPVDPATSGFRAGDRIIAVGAVPISSWLGSGTTTGEPGAELTTYTVLRGADTVAVSVTGGSGSFWATVALDWPLYVFLLYLAGVGVLVFVRRPDLRTARMFLRFSVAMLTAETIYLLGFSVAELRGAPFVLYASAANAVLFFYAVAAGLHFALAFPRAQPILARRPGLTLAATYLAPWIAYLAIMASDPGLFGDPVGVFLRHWQAICYVGAGMAGAILLAFLTAFLRIETAVDRRQLRWVVFGVGIAFLPWIVLLAASLVTPLPMRELFDVMSIGFAAIPTTVAIAIVRERAFDIDLIVNRTLVYVALTAVLAGIYAATVALVQRVLLALTGAQSDGAIVLATLVVVIVFSPIRDALQRLVDRRYKGLSPGAVALRELGDQVAGRLNPIDPGTVCRRFAELTRTGLDASGVAIRLVLPGGTEFVAASGDAPDPPALQIPVKATSGESLGVLELGARPGGRPFDRDDRELCAEIAAIIADAIVLDRPVVTHRRRGPARSAV